MSIAAERSTVNWDESSELPTVVEVMNEKIIAVPDMDLPLAAPSTETPAIRARSTESVEAGVEKAKGTAQDPPAAHAKQGAARESKMGEIMTLIDDPAASKADLARMIAWEMASILAHIENSNGESASDASKVKSSLEQLKGVRELGRQLIEADNANQDYINFDGNKFKKVMDYFFETSKDALREIGFDDNTVKNFIMHWSEILGKSEAKLRREVQDIK